MRPVLFRITTIVALLVLPHARAYAQETSKKGWSLDFGAGATLSPGFGDASTAVGFVGSATLVRTNTLDEFGSHRCLGLTALFHQTWDEPFDASGPGPEQWLAAGPRWDAAEPGEPYVLLHLAGGVKRRLRDAEPEGQSGGGSIHPAFAVGLGFGVPTAQVRGSTIAWRAFEVNLLMAPGDGSSRYRVLFGSGVELSLPFTNER
jgi:hypothetical protein